MKRIKFISIAISLLLVLVLLMSSCGLTGPAYEGQSKEFETDDLKITLTNRFFESENEERDFFFLSTTCGATGFKEHYSTMFESKNATIADYASLMRQANSQMNPSEIKVEEGLTYIECTGNDDDGESWTYFLTFLRNGDYFWTVQFHCMTEEYEEFKPYFIEWANSISFK